METSAMIQDPFFLLTILIAVPAITFVLADWGPTKGFFRVVPIIVFAYFVPSTLSSFDIIPSSAPLYSSLKLYVLPALLFLLTLSADLKTILRLGSKTLIMFFAGTAGIFLGAPVALALFHNHLPPEIWKGMGALAGSWIGASANFVAVGDSLNVDQTMLSMVAIVDLIIGSTWAGILMYFAGKYEAIDAAMGADNSVVHEVKERIETYQKATRHHPSLKDLLEMAGLACVSVVIALVGSQWLPVIGDIVNAATWRIIIVTALGLGLSFTPLRRLDGAGASNIGSFLLYIIIGTIGAGADFGEMMKYPYLIAVGAVWIAIHALVVFIAMRWTKSPLFLAAVGSQANIGGTASAPIVASAFHPSLASVGVLLGILGNVVGTYVALLLAKVLQCLTGILG